MRCLIAAIVFIASAARAAPVAPPGPADFDCNGLDLCDPAVMSARELHRCNARAERDRCAARVVSSAAQAWQAARRECRKPGRALDTMVEAIHVTGVGPKVIDRWAKLSVAQHDAFDALVEPLADQLLGGPAERADAIASVCDRRVRFDIVFADNSTVRVFATYVDGGDHIVNRFYMMLFFQRPRRPGETWAHYELDDRKSVPPSGPDDRRWHYYGDVENGLVDAREPRSYDQLRARLGGGDYDKALASLRAAP